MIQDSFGIISGTIGVDPMGGLNRFTSDSDPCGWHNFMCVWGFLGCGGSWRSRKKSMKISILNSKLSNLIPTLAGLEGFNTGAMISGHGHWIFRRRSCREPEPRSLLFELCH